MNQMGSMLDIESVGDENMVYSPASLKMALSMLAKGATEEALLYIGLFLGDSDMESLYKNSKEAEGLAFANSLWLADGMKPNMKYVDSIEKIFDADVIVGGTSEDVNQWISEKTDGLISNITDENPEAAIINTILFDMPWRAEEEDTVSGDFINSRGEVEKANYIFSMESNYLENDKVTGFMRPYKEEGYYFVGILPKNPNMKLNEIDIREMLRSNQYRDVRIMLPEFAVETKFDNIKDDLKEFGIDTVLKADGIVKSKDALVVKSITQVNKVEVTKAGTKAAATEMDMTFECCDFDYDREEPKEVYLNRPFIFAIYSEKEHASLFLGRVKTMK